MIALNGADYSARYSGHYFLAVLVATDECRRDVRQLLNLLQRRHSHLALDRVAGKNRAMELESHFAGDEIHIAANLGWQRRCQQPMSHQPT